MKTMMLINVFIRITFLCSLD